MSKSMRVTRDVVTDAGLRMSFTLERNLSAVKLTVGPFIELDTTVIEAAVQSLYDVSLEEVRDNATKTFSVGKEIPNGVEVIMHMADGSDIVFEMTKVLDGICIRVSGDSWTLANMDNIEQALNYIFNNMVSELMTEEV